MVPRWRRAKRLAASQQRWKFWRPEVWRAWWSDPRAWGAHKQKLGDLKRQIAETSEGIEGANQGIAQARRAMEWLGDSGRKEIPVSTAKAEVGLASVEGVTLFETRKREGKEVWTPVDRGSVHFTDRHRARERLRPERRPST